MESKPAGLPETARIELEGEERLEIEDHRPDRSLFEWLWLIVWFDKPERVFAEMEDGGITWRAAAETAMKELEHSRGQLDSLVYEWLDDGTTMAECQRFLGTSTGQEIRDGMIRTVNNCKSFAEFAAKFERYGRFHKDVINRISGRTIHRTQDQS